MPFFVISLQFAEEYQGIFIYFGGLLATGFSIWLTAKLSFRSTVRQKVWQKVYEEKRKTIEDFSEIIVRFVAAVNAAMNLGQAPKENYYGALGKAGFVLKALQQFPEFRDECAGIEKTLLGIQDGEKTDLERRKLNKAIKDLQYLLLMELGNLVLNLRKSCTRLSLLVNDPRQPWRLLDAAIDTYNGLANNHDWTKVDPHDLVGKWDNLSQTTMWKLRQDLDDSSKSLRHAVHHSKHWSSEMEVMASELNSGK